MTPGMAPAEPAYFYSQLADRRNRLNTALAAHPESHDLERLLGEVDAALDRIAKGTFGICEICGDTVEAERLAADPLIRVCIDHLSEGERRDLERDLQLAVEIQTTLLPKSQLQAGEWETCYYYQPAGPVSGDYCDLIPADGRGLFFFTGDVSGKGVAASLLMSHLHAIFRSLVQFGMPVTELVSRANHVFCESTSASKYATLLCGRAGAEGDIAIANAGHCPPVCLRAAGTEAIEATGLPLGMFCSVQYEERRIHLEPGDSLVLYTDGLTEARDSADVEYGDQRLASLLAGQHGAPARAIADACVADLQKHVGGKRLKDDLTILVVRRSPAAA